MALVLLTLGLVISCLIINVYDHMTELWHLKANNLNKLNCEWRCYSRHVLDINHRTYNDLFPDYDLSSLARFTVE